MERAFMRQWVRVGVINPDLEKVAKTIVRFMVLDTHYSWPDRKITPIIFEKMVNWINERKYWILPKKIREMEDSKIRELFRKIFSVNDEKDTAGMLIELGRQAPMNYHWAEFYVYDLLFLGLSEDPFVEIVANCYPDAEIRRNIKASLKKFDSVVIKE